jgi:hypothetical protein
LDIINLKVHYLGLIKKFSKNQLTIQYDPNLTLNLFPIEKVDGLAKDTNTTLFSLFTILFLCLLPSCQPLSPSTEGGRGILWKGG